MRPPSGCVRGLGTSTTINVTQLGLDAPRFGVVEDEGIFCDFIAAVCRKEFNGHVVAKEREGKRGLARILSEQPDLVILDVVLPDIDGLEIARQVRAEIPACRIIVLTALCDTLTYCRVRDLGLPGFIDKREPCLETLIAAISSVLAGKTYYSEVYLRSLAELQKDPRAFNRVLSPYEQDILVLICNYYDDEEIGVILGIARATAQSRRRDIMRKLDLHTTPKLIQYGTEMGFGRPPRYLCPTPKAAPEPKP